MFGTMFAGVDDPAELVAAVEQAGREEAAAHARKLAAIAELAHQSLYDEDPRAKRAFDPWTYLCTEIGAALTLSTRRASGQLRIALALRERLPKVAELACEGRLSARLLSELSWRTHLVNDDAAALVDAALAHQVSHWGTLSEGKLIEAIEAVIDRYDPDAVRRSREAVKSRDLTIGGHDDPHETVAIWGRLLAHDAAALKARITAMVKGLCARDPRTPGERRSDAAGAIAHGHTVLPCRCGSPDCPAPTTAASSGVTISVLADPAAVTAALELLAEQDREHQARLAEGHNADTPPDNDDIPPWEHDTPATPPADSEPVHEPVSAATESTTVTAGTSAEEPAHPDKAEHTDTQNTEGSAGADAQIPEESAGADTTTRRATTIPPPTDTEPDPTGPDREDSATTAAAATEPAEPAATDPADPAVAEPVPPVTTGPPGTPTDGQPPQGTEPTAPAAGPRPPEPPWATTVPKVMGRPRKDTGVAVLSTGEILPLIALAEALRAGAILTPLWQPGPDPEPHYRPSAKLAAYIRARDMFCRFPGCDVPAARCDIDHVIPWPYGPTHPSNLNCTCRTHHLGKVRREALVFRMGVRDPDP
ncbi:DUF222 domain-containing protein [Mycolicibacterium sp.]|uniref:HNH endonuclease signature motif containing protein n=1 Tax=Mycolicibacterium sp. TaxID=2320850 RepID=UPI003D0F3C4C